MLEIHTIKALADNYIYILHCNKTNEVAVVDPAKASLVLDFLDKHNLKLNFIFNTHHHFDHIGGNKELKKKTGCKIFGFKKDRKRIPAIDVELEDEESFYFAGRKIKVLYLPGHTLGIIAYHIPQENLLFVGDVLFTMGCGRLFEGEPLKMYESLQKIYGLPDDTEIYSAHEYAVKNAEFALLVEPKNQILQERYKDILKKREQDIPIQPTTLSKEKQTNPFLRCDEIEIKYSLNIQEASSVEVFTKLREMRNNF